MPTVLVGNGSFDGGAGTALDEMSRSSEGSGRSRDRSVNSDDSARRYASGSKGKDSKRDSRGSASSMPEPRKRPCCCISCCEACLHCHTRSVYADCEELEKVRKAMKHLTLREDVVVNGELIHKESHLIKVGRKWRRSGYWEVSRELEDDCIEILKEIIEEEEAIRLVFSCPRIRFPWCMVLKVPCCTFFLTLIGVFSICAAGIRGNISIETNTDSFLESDSESSTYYSAFLQAIKDKQADSRRLQATKPPDDNHPQWSWLSWRNLRDEFREAATLPVLDGSRWHPFRYLARIFCLLAGEEIYVVADDDWKELGIDHKHDRRLGNLYKNHKIALIYATKDESSIFNPEHMAKMRSIEQKLKGYPEWNDLCKDADPPKKKFCDPGFSFANIAYGYPAQVGTKTSLIFNGSGTELVPMELAVGYGKQQGVFSMMLPDDQASAATYEVVGVPCSDRNSACAQYEQEGHCQPFAEYELFMHDFCDETCNFCGPSKAYANFSGSAEEVVKEKVTAIRSNFNFQAFCCKSNEPPGPGKKRLTELWNSFVAQFVKDLSSAEFQDGSVRVFYTGDGVATYEALNAVYSDLMWALGSYCFVVVYATLHTRSVFLSTVGLFLVMMSIPTALAIFALAANSETVSLMSCLSIFIVIGVGSDMLFVYTDFWKQSVQQSRDPVKRLKFMYMQAGSSTAATTFTTAMSFLANLASVLRPLREFGFFMGACVVMAWVIMFFGYPPILVLGERCHRRLRRCASASIDADEKEEALAKTASMGRKSINMVKNRSTVALMKMLDPEKVGVGEVHKNFLGATFADFLGDWKCSLALIFFSVTVGSAFVTAKELKQATGVPQIFPPEHNQVLGQEYASKFANFDDDISFGVSVTECNDLFQNCNQFKCKSHGRAMGSSFECQCYPHGKKIGDCTNPADSKVHMRVLGRKGLTATMVEQANFTGCFMTQYPGVTAISRASTSISISDILLENWESGKKMLGILARPDVVRMTHPGGTQGHRCEEKQVCYCGIARCAGAGSGIGYGTLELHRPYQRILETSEDHPLADALLSRSLQSPAPAPAVRPENRVDVNVVFGLKVKSLTRLVGLSEEQPYEFDASFNLPDPWAQRQMKALCTGMVEDEGLKIASSLCWVLGFHSYWTGLGRGWPLRAHENIDTQVHTWANRNMIDGYQATQYFWFDGTKIQATYVVFFLSISKLVSATEALEVKDKWDEYMATFNSEAADSIKDTWHASKLWVRAEAEKVIIGSTMNTLSISLGCVLLGILAFTFSLHLAIMVMFVVMAIIIGLAFFMVVLMEWPVGAIEVLCLIVFVGFAVDYCLHVAHKYHTCHIKQVSALPPEEVEQMEHASSLRKSSRFSGGRKRPSLQIDIGDKPVDEDSHPSAEKHKDNHKVLLAKNRSEERFARTKYALERMGGAVVGSACTTVGCAAFLLPCQLVIFTKIGSVVMAVTVYAILYTVLPLPAILMIMGPCGGDLTSFIRCIINCNRKYCCGRAKEKSDIPAPDDDNYIPRRYVLHMPIRAMSEKSRTGATRTRVTATG